MPDFSTSHFNIIPLFVDYLIYTTVIPSRYCIGNALHLHLGGAQFESRLGHMATVAEILYAVQSRAARIHRLGYVRFFRNPTQISFRCHPTIRCCRTVIPKLFR